MDARVAVHAIDHVTVAVRDFDAARRHYEELFATDLYEFDDTTLADFGGGRSALSADGIQLVETQGGKLSDFVDRSGEAAVGIAFRVPDVDEAVASLTGCDLRLIGKCDRPGWRAAAFDPADTCGVMVKVVEYLPGYSVGDLEVVRLWREASALDARPLSPSGPAIRSRGIDHVLVYVSDIETAAKLFSRLLRTEFPPPHESVTGSYLAVDGIGIELISSEGAASGVNRFIMGRAGAGASGEGVSAVSFLVDDWDEAVAAVAQRGGQPIATRELPSRRVALYAATAGLGIGLELIEYRRLAHPAVCLSMVDDLRRRR